MDQKHYSFIQSVFRYSKCKLEKLGKLLILFAAYMKQKTISIVTRIRSGPLYTKTQLHFRQWGKRMIGPIEKGFQAAKVSVPPVGTYDGVDLSILPKYISYKAALVREKLTFQYLLGIFAILFVGHYVASKLEVSNLYTKLREKEYILAPGVLDFTTASPQSVPDSYVNDAATDFLSNIGNVNPQNIDEQYASLNRFMSDQLKVQFQMETADWVRQVKSENISQLLTVTDKEITSNESGAYKVVALGRADFYAENQYLGHEDQVIEMILRLTPPESGKRWYLEITSLSWTKAKTFETKNSLKR